MNELNCLQCKHAQLLPQTDFTQRGTSIYCGARPLEEEVGPRVVNLTGCPQSEPMPRQGHGLRWNAVADQFMRQSLPIATREKRAIALKILGRSSFSFDTHARVLGLNPNFSSEEIKRVNGRNGKMRSRGLNQAQTDFLANRVKTGPFPQSGGDYDGPFGVKQRSIRRDIIRRVAALGEPKEWSTILRHCYLQSPAYKQKQKLKRRHHERTNRNRTGDPEL